MKPQTAAIIQNALNLDSTIKCAIKRAITEILDDDYQLCEWISERQAAKVLGVGNSTLNRWRTSNEWQGELFPFSLYEPVRGAGPRYNKFELIEWVTNKTALPPKTDIELLCDARQEPVLQRTLATTCECGYMIKSYIVKFGGEGFIFCPECKQEVKLSVVPLED